MKSTYLVVIGITRIYTEFEDKNMTRSHALAVFSVWFVKLLMTELVTHSSTSILSYNMLVLWYCHYYEIRCVSYWSVWQVWQEKMTRRHVLVVLWMQFSRNTSDWTSDWLIYNDAACIVLLHVLNMNMSVFLT